MFRIISIVGFLIALVWIIRGFARQHESSQAINRWFFSQKQAIFDRENRVTSLTYLRGFFYLLAVLAVLILAFSGFLPVLFTGKHLSGFLMILHVTAAPFLAVSLALLSLFYAHRNRFSSTDLESLSGRQQESEPVNGARIIALKKICFWLLIALSIPLISSILLSMFTIYGTIGQSFLLHLHGYSALCFVIVAMVHAYFSILEWKD